MPYTTNVPSTPITAAWANENVRDQVVTPFGSASARASAVTSPIEGMVTYLTDADALEVYNGTDWVPVGPATVDALNITTASPFITGYGGGSATTEVSSKMRLTAPRVYDNQLYRIHGCFIAVLSATGTDYTFLCREDTASGTIVGSFFVTKNDTAGGAVEVSFELYWPCAADASSKVFVFTALRTTGAGTLGIQNIWQGGPALFLAIDRVGAAASYRSVP